jgi:uncharacterized protein (TIGR03118 family)
MKISWIKALLVIAVLGLSASVSQAGFDWKNLQSDINGVAEMTDPNVINPWGMAVSPAGNIWVANNHTGVATVYFPDGSPAPNSTTPLVVTIPKSASNSDPNSNPTGVVLNGTSFFKVTKGSNTLPAKFIFVNEDGVISGWNSTLDNTNAIQALDNGGTAVYKGVTIGAANNHNYLYATNFHAGKVETYDENFVLQTSGFPFVDPGIPADYAPFGIRNINGQIFVTFAKRNSTNPDDDQAGAGFGFISVFNQRGQLLRRLVSTGNLNAPWGLALVNGDLWVGNFGDGHINVYNPANGHFIGTPKDDARPLAFDGLWDLVVKGGGVYFTAGIAGEADGLFGVISTD